MIGVRGPHHTRNGVVNIVYTDWDYVKLGRVVYRLHYLAPIFMSLILGIYN